MVVVQRQCQNRDSVGTETVWEQGQCGYRDSIGAETVWEQGQCWYRDSVGTGTVLVQGQCWCSSTVGAGTVLVQGWYWCRDGVGTGTVLVQGQCWCRDGVGAGTVLVQKHRSTYSGNIHPIRQTLPLIGGEQRELSCGWGRYKNKNGWQCWYFSHFRENCRICWLCGSHSLVSGIQNDTAVSWITLWGMIKVYWWYSS